MPITDKDVGITELLGSHRPFRAILKQSIDDFVVNEVLLSGKVAQLTRLAEAPHPPPRTDNRNQPQSGDTKETDGAAAAERKHHGAASSELPFDKLEACFSEESKIPASDAIRTTIEADATEVVLPICTDKQMRKDIHEWVRINMPSYVTDTVEQEANGQKGQAVRLRKRKSCRPWKRRRTNRQDESDRPSADAANNDTYDPREERDLRHKRGEGREDTPAQVGRNTYVRFVLWKRNKDTLEALTMLSKILRIPSSAFTFAGTKDKRAVTTQLVQVRGVSEGRLASANKMVARRDRGQRSMAVGNVEIMPRDSPKALGLGDLLGNRFTLALRDLDIEAEADQKNIEAAVDNVRTRGFVNYFGLQRFGSGVSATHETGFAFLRGDFEDVCRRILLPLRMDEWAGQGTDGIRPERQRLNDALDKFAKKEIRAKELLQVLPRWMHIEAAIVTSFAHDEEQGRKIYDYRAAFEKLPRNLRRMYGHAVQSYLWNIMASERIRVSRPDDPSRMHAIKGDLVVADPEGKKEMNYETSVRAVTEQEEQEKSVSIFRVLIPVLGSEVALPEDADGEAAKAVMKEQQIDLKNRVSADYGMKGTYRPLLVQPKDVEMKIVPYANTTDTLIQSSVLPSAGRGKDVVDAESRGNQNVDDVNGSDPQKQATDSTISGTDNIQQSEDPSVPGKLVSDADTKRSEAVQEAAAIAKDTKGAAESEGARKALVISFNLGRGEFATMLVRELTRKDSSTANQKAMQDAIRKETG